MASQTKRSAPAIVQKLVETFEQNLDSYRSSKNETELRREFLDKFFTALGWDVANEKAYDEAHKEVVHEFSVEVSGQQKKADYAFRVGSAFDFLVEAKKPSVKIEASQDAAFQIRRYGWSAKLPINILTDFEHFAVYDCRAKPNYNDKATTGRILLIHYTEYVERWDEIAAIFSPEAVRQGSFAKYAEGMKGKRGTADVDDAFLQEIERWRELLAKNIALRNEDIDIPGLNYAVQMTIDRIVFLRICEERGIEAENQLLDIANGADAYRELCELFKRADTKYNSGLFHFKQEKEQASRADDLTLDLAIDDKVLKDIISNLYYPKSPYAFLYIPADILGQVYERFLGKVIRLTAGHQAKVEEKPEVRKAGGVYYTPTYIVDYIVKNTVGKLLEGEGQLTAKNAKSAKQNLNLSGLGGLGGSKGLTPTDAAKLKIVDPACGSGTFLLGAYQFLLDWHLNWYVNDDAEKWEKNKTILKVESGYRLTTSKKKEILLNNIHGVDIDAQAVEVTKLSLLLKVLENASGQMGLGMERVLPDLGNNIKCGNSLIGWDYFEGQLLPDDEERARVNPFDWKSEFPQVFTGDGHLRDDRHLGRGGFDVVIGNPPYVRIQTLGSQEIRYFSKKYRTAIGNYDIYCPFLEKAIELSKGYASFILPHRFFKTDYGDGLRAFLSNGKHVKKIMDFDGYMVFKDASINTCILVVSKKPNETFSFSQMQFVSRNEDEVANVLNNAESEDEARAKEMIKATLSSQNLTNAPWIFILPKEEKIWEKLHQINNVLEKISKQIFQGLKTGADLIFSVDVLSRDGSVSTIYSKFREANYQIEDGLLHPQIKGGEMKRFKIGDTTRAVIFPYKNGKLIEAKVMQAKYPLTWKYFKENQKYLEEREDGKTKGENWYGYTRSQALTSMEQKKILTPDYYAHPSYCLDETGDYFFFGGGAGGYGIVLDENYDYFYTLGLLNSRLLEWFISKISVRQYQTAFSYVKKYIEQLPIRTINFTDPAEKAQHDKMVALVEAMLALRKSLAAAHSPAEKERLERQIQVTDREIDSLVYQLYGLTEEEIGIVEGK